MRVHRHHLGPLLALLSSAVSIAGAAVTGEPAFAAGNAAGASSTGGSSAATGSGAAAGSDAIGGSSSSSAETQSSPGSQDSGSGASKAAGIVQSGIATWYGPGLYGHKTACGQRLTPAVVGVASRTLACGTLVKVSYDGRSKIVPVLDRGPYAHNGASWDLTAGAATALDITETVRISALVVGSVPNSLALGSPPVTPGETALGGAQAS